MTSAKLSSNRAILFFSWLMEQAGMGREKIDKCVRFCIGCSSSSLSEGTVPLTFPNRARAFIKYMYLIVAQSIYFPDLDGISEAYKVVLMPFCLLVIVSEEDLWVFTWSPLFVFLHSYSSFTYSRVVNLPALCSKNYVVPSCLLTCFKGDHLLTSNRARLTILDMQR